MEVSRRRVPISIRGRISTAYGRRVSISSHALKWHQIDVYCFLGFKFETTTRSYSIIPISAQLLSDNATLVSGSLHPGSISPSSQFRFQFPFYSRRSRGPISVKTLHAWLEGLGVRPFWKARFNNGPNPLASDWFWGQKDSSAWEAAATRLRSHARNIRVCLGVCVT